MGIPTSDFQDPGLFQEIFQGSLSFLKRLCLSEMLEAVFLALLILALVM
jgi:hypothetical protein